MRWLPGGGGKQEPPPLGSRHRPPRNQISYQHQADFIRKILEHCGLWHDPPPRAPRPGPGIDHGLPTADRATRPAGSSPASGPGIRARESPTRSIPTSWNISVARQWTSPNCTGSHEPVRNMPISV